jgi:hypothetical protein
MANKINTSATTVTIKTPGPRGPQGPAGSAADFDSTTDIEVRNLTGSIISSSYSGFGVIADSGSFNHINVSGGITASNLFLDANTLYIGGTSFSRNELDSLKEGRSIATNTKGGFSNFIEAPAFISSVDNNVLIRTAANRMSLNAGGGYILDLRGDTNKVVITGSLDILAASPAITMTGDIHQAKGGYLIKDTGSIGDNILQYDDNFGIADYAEGVSDYTIYNQHNFQLAPRGRISGSFGMTQGFHNSATFFSFAHGRDTSCKPPINNIGHWPQGNTDAFGDSLTYDTLNSVSGLNYGLAAHSEGRSTQANVPYSHAEGFECITTGSSVGSNHAEGYRTTAEGNYAHSEGGNTIALGLASHTEGLFTIASGAYQHVQGKYNTHGNTTSLMIIGNGTNDSTRSDLALFNTSGVVFQGSLNIQTTVTPNTAEGDYSLAHGISTHASGAHSHAEGTATLAQGRTSHAEGYYTTASGDSSHAEGSKAIASGRYSHAEGIETQAIEEGSHAEGYKTAASGLWSHAAGSGSRAQHTGAFVAGNNVSSRKEFQTVVGAYNNFNSTGVDDIEEAYFVVGVGTDASNRRNAMAVTTSSIVLNPQMIPTSDPNVMGQLWRDGTDLKISLG